MRKIIALSAIAPIAMLAACGDNEVENEAMTAENAEMTTEMTSPVEPQPAQATTLDEAGDFSGTYDYTGEDGTSTSVTLNSEDDSYEYTDAEGEVRTGNFTRLDDGYRLRIEDWNGAPAWFTISQGDLIRLQQDSSVTSDITVEGERFVRSDEDAMFSRDPELGSPVAPQQ